MNKSSSTPRQSIYKLLFSTLPLWCSLLVLVLLGVRQLTSNDLGYHLAFGETFFESGKIVDHTPFIYTLPSPEMPESDRPEPGPGNWYDDQGRYRFPNANWLSQVVIYGAWRLGGIMGLNVLRLILVAGLFVLLTAAMKRSKVPSLLIPPALLLVGVTINARLDLRPELFGYLCLLGQYIMLSKVTIQSGRPSSPPWIWVAGMVAIQLVFVNLHSYFLLGLAVTGAVLVEYLFAFFKSGMQVNRSQNSTVCGTAIYRLGVTLTGMVLVCFVNPWGWRLAFLPLQTLLYMKKYSIGTMEFAANAHPWNYIFEFRAFRQQIEESGTILPSQYAFMIVLAIAAAAIILQLAVMVFTLYKNAATGKKSVSGQETTGVKWAHLFITAGMGFVGLQMWRNIAVASLIAVPASLACITGGLQYFLGENLERLIHKVFVLAGAAAILLSVYGGYQVVSGKLYDSDLMYNEFGFGISSTRLPMGAADWLNKNAPGARVWCDFDSSSTLRFFTRPHKDLPILTNTWAYPPGILYQNEIYRALGRPFGPVARKYNIDAVVLRMPAARNLVWQLDKDPGWKLVHTEGIHVLFVRSGQNG
jgi:hypothetical protein